MHPLDGAYQRVERAEHHLSEIRTRCEAHGEAMRHAITVERKPATLRFPDGREVRIVLSEVSGRSGEVPLRIAILLGEAIYNLRAALDYLIHELALLDAKERREGTYFPIESTEEGFIKHRPTYLNGVNEAHVRAIELLQPYKGCDWTGRLRDISNPDKHSRLSTLASPVRVSPAPGSTERIIAGEDAELQNEVSVFVAFSDGAPVIHTLEGLLASVTQTIQAFDGDFR